MKMATNWKIPTGRDLAKVISVLVIRKSDENIDTDSVDALLASTPPKDQNEVPFDAELESRSNELVSTLVDTVRETIQNAGRNPISVTANAVPPKAFRHILNIAAFQLINSTPNLQMVIMTDKGAYSPFQTFYKEGMAYIKRLEDGDPVLPPTDPTGLDYLTAVDANTNPPISAVSSAPMIGLIDLSTDGVDIDNALSGDQYPNGYVIGSIGNVYEQKSNGIVIKVWEKISGQSTNTGWQ